MIPSLPKYDYRKKLSEEQLMKRAVYYERWVECVLKSMTLRSCELVVEFLREKDEMAFEVKAEVALGIEAPH